MLWLTPRIPVLAYSAWGHYSASERNSFAFRIGLTQANLLTSDAPDVLDEIGHVSPSTKRAIVRFGADIDLFSPGSPDNEFLKNYGLSSSIPYIFSPRPIRENYNQITIVRALPKIINKFPDVHLILKNHHTLNYPDSLAYQEQIYTLAKSLNVCDRIIPINHIPYEQLVQLYRASRVAVSIPLEDGFSYHF